MMWIIIFGLMLICGIGGLIFLLTRFRRFGLVRKLAGDNKRLSWILAGIPLLIIGASAFISIFAFVVILIHLTVFWLICDLAAHILKRITKKEVGRYYAGAAALAITAVYLSTGWFLAHHVYRTEYSLSTSKFISMGKMRVVMLADLHLGLTLDGDEFARQMQRIEDEKPDVVIIPGDFVDDSSRKDDMIKACKALNIKTTFGVYFVYGNHDKGYYNNRDFTYEELEEELYKNGVTVLKDEYVLVSRLFYIIGRQDKSEDERASMEELMSGVDKSKFIIVADHQPNSFDEEAAAGADLVLSGHTHGGHIWPAGQIGLLIGANDRIYGMEKRNDTTFIVTSGISGWAIPFKTGTKSEYVVIDIEQKQNAD
ncbi:MAG: metallophosphoesterase [Ruminococcus sp.]|nr:metallophosphoesterase [Ruminococcus sp.]